MCCGPLRKRHPGHRWHRAALAYGQSKRFERIGSGTSIVIPPTSSISCLKLEKSTATTWLIGSEADPLVRLGDAAPERQEAEQRPDHEEQEEDAERHADPPTPAPAPAGSFRPRGARRLAVAAVGAGRGPRSKLTAPDRTAGLVD